MNFSSDERLDLTAVKNHGENATDLSGQEENLFKVLHDVVQPGDAITPDSAAEQINEYLRSHPNRSEEREPDTEVVGDYLGSLWSLLTSVVEYTPYSHPGQDRLIATMQSLIKITEGSYAIWGQSALQVWSDLPLLGPCVREKWNWAATPSFNNPYYEMPGAKEWINTNAFTARLIGSRIVNWETFPIWALREAFEEPFRSVAENDIHALVAAQWIFHAGKVIYELSVEESLVENPRITKGGSLFDGESGFNMKRWAFWKKRAGELSSEASDDVREIASAVVEKMSEIEGEK